MRQLLIFAISAVAVGARPEVDLDLRAGEFNGSSDCYSGGLSKSFISAGESGGAVTYSGGEVTQGETQVIDIGGPAGENVIIKPVVQQGPPIISRNFYIHEAPEEPQNTRVEEKIIEVRPQKGYKIIFIKTPSQDGFVGGSNAAVFPQNEEKTIVYVLSKKAEGGVAGGELSTPPAAVVSKPEVFFVKYKTKAEANAAIAKIQESFQEGGAGYNSPGSFAQGIDAKGDSSGGFSDGSLSGSLKDSSDYDSDSANNLASSGF